MDNKFFESVGGALNMLPTKISGQYKIVLSFKDLESEPQIFLDNFNGYRIPIDKTVSWMEQICRFLKVQSVNNDPSKYRYGGFREISNTYSYNIPFYLSSDKTQYPLYFVMNRVPNQTIDSEAQLYSNCVNLLTIDLRRVGLHKLFDEINSEDYYKYLTYFNWDSNSLNIYGCNFIDCQPSIKTISLLNYAANQPYYDVFNNMILNEFQKSNMIWPRFLSVCIEFPYDYESNNRNPFVNFFGYLSTGNQNANDFKYAADIKFPTIKYGQTTDKNPSGLYIVENTNSADSITKHNYYKKIGNIQILDIHEQPYQYRFALSTIQPTDVFRIKQNGIVIGELSFSNYSMISNIYEIRRIWIELSSQLVDSIGNIKFDIVIKNGRLLVTCIFSHIPQDIVFELPVHYRDIDASDYTPINIETNDIQCISEGGQLAELFENKKLLIEFDSKYYQIAKIFKFNGQTILRLTDEGGVAKIINLRYLTVVDLFEEALEEYRILRPIDFLTYYIDISSSQLYDIEGYKQSLKEQFKDSTNKKLFELALKNFNLQLMDNDFNQYVYDDGESRLDKKSIDFQHYNEQIVKHIMFSCGGSTSHLTPYILNIDKQFYIQNGSVDFNPENHNDYYKFAWFLLNGQVPNYLIGKQQALRYCENINNPRMYSVLKSISNHISECVFLGVKYQLPKQYADYKFWTVLNFNNSNYDESVLEFRVDDIKKTVILVFNRYLNYNDLIRGGDERNQPIIDLSLFHNVTDSSDYSSTINSSLIDCNFIISPFYDLKNPRYKLNDVKQSNWIAKDASGKTKFCILQSSNQTSRSLLTLFPNHRNDVDSLKCYIYNKFEYDGNKVNYQICEVEFTEVVLEDDYLWCSDCIIKFFENNRFYIYEDSVNGTKLNRIWKSNIIGEPKRVNHYMDNVTVEYTNSEGKMIRSTFDMLKSAPISLKQEYFDFERKITHLGTTETLHTICRPNEFIYDFAPKSIIRATDNNQLISKIKERFESRIQGETVSDVQSFDIFDVNQVWNYVKNMLKSHSVIKQSDSNSIKQQMNIFSFQEFINNIKRIHNNIPISNKSGQYINLQVPEVDTNLVVWESNINKLQEYKIFEINRYNTAYNALMQPVQSDIDFQLLEFQRERTFWNMFDAKNQYLTEWSEIQGNMVSTLFTGRTYTVQIGNTSNSINIRTLFNNVISDNLIYMNRQIDEKLKQSLLKYTRNFEEYIRERFIDIMLTRYYRISSVKQNGLNLKYYVSDWTLHIEGTVKNSMSPIQIMFELK